MVDGSVSGGRLNVDNEDVIFMTIITITIIVIKIIIIKVKIGLGDGSTTILCQVGD